MDVKVDKEIIDRIKHIESFYEQAPPGYLKEEEEKPEDCIPDEDGNKEARDFLANAPKKGLWMPLGKEVKVMQCWRCKQYGHRTGDKECPMFKSGNSAIEKFREAYEDPMYHFFESSKREENEKKKNWLQQLLDVPTTSESSSDDDSKKRKKKKKKKLKSKKRKSPEKNKKSKKKSTNTDSEDERHARKHHKSKKHKKKSLDPESYNSHYSANDSKNKRRKNDSPSHRNFSPKKHKHKS